MNSKVALVTGGTSGIGRSLLPELVRAGFFVHFIGRDGERGRQIEAELNASHEPVARFVRLDLSEPDRVRAFARSFRDQIPQLDLLANVAGAMFPERQVSAQGFEKTFAIGYLSVFVLATELAPALAKGGSSRIINVAGRPRFVLKPSLDFDDLGFEKAYNGMDVAIKTVHAKTVLTEILAERLADQGISVTSFHPGGIKSNLGRNMSLPMRTLFGVANLFMATTSKSAVHVATSPEVQGTTGELFVGRKGQKLNFEPAYKAALWNRTLAMVG